MPVSSILLHRLYETALWFRQYIIPGSLGWTPAFCMADSSHCFYYPFIVGIPFATRVRVPYICAPCRVPSIPKPPITTPHPSPFYHLHTSATIQVFIMHTESRTFTSYLFACSRFAHTSYPWLAWLFLDFSHIIDPSPLCFGEWLYTIDRNLKINPKSKQSHIINSQP